MTAIRVLDISAYDQHGDLAACKRAGYRGVIIKATEGLHFVSDRLDAQRAASRAIADHNWHTGFYHFAHPANDPVAEARRFVAVANPRPGESVWLDFEITDGQSPDHNSAWAKSFCEELQRLAGHTPGIYTGAWFWNPQTRGSGWASRYPLWLSAYTQHQPAPPYPWKETALWQYTDADRPPSFGQNVDCSVFNGDEAQWAHFQAQFGAHSAPAPAKPASKPTQPPADHPTPPHSTPGGPVAAVASLQRLIGVKDDGLWGPHTEQAAAAHTLRRGANSPLVGWVQQRLNSHGAKLTVDNDFGPKTTGALVPFKEAHHLPAEPVVGAPCFKALAS